MTQHRHTAMTSPTRWIWSCVLCVALGPGVVSAGDWPQILGPHRNGIAEGEKLREKWPAKGPPALWSHKAGAGFAGVAVAEGKAILFHRQGDEEIVACLDAATGKPQWETRFPTDYTSTISDDNGPRCVPLIQDGSVYVYGAGGDLHCLRFKDGDKVWSRETFKDYNAPAGYFGAGSTPIVEGDKLLVNVGGDRAGAGIVAVDLKTGKTLWTATKELASYSSPTAATLGGIRHVIFVTRLHAMSLDPADGSVRWEFPFGARGPTVNAATPLVLDGNLFLSASYGVGAVFAKIEPKAAKILWESTDIMSSQYSTCVAHEGLLYGIDGREDVGAAALRCFDPKTQKIHWTEQSFGVGNLLLADGKLLIMKVSGELVLARPNGKKYEPLATAKLFDSESRSLPALSNGRLYVRDRRTFQCIDLRPGN